MVQVRWRGRQYRPGPRTVRRLAFLGILMAVATFGGALQRVVWFHRRVATVQAELQLQRQRNAALERALQEAMDPRSIERRARTTMGLVKPGELVFEPAIPVPDNDPYRVPRR